MGLYHSLFVVGSVDELNVKNRRLYILDTKTRRFGNMPSVAQKTTTRFQLMTYNKLLHNLVAGKFSHSQLLKSFGLRDDDTISHEFKKQINEIGDQIEPNVRNFSIATLKLFKNLPPPEKAMIIKYETQDDRELIGTDEFSFEPERFQRDCDFVESFWMGKRKTIPVGTRNAWKCNYCEFEKDCGEKPNRNATNRVNTLDNFFI